jgi:hypothetical protein
MRRFLVFIFSLFTCYLLLVTSLASAEVGVRQMGMGGAAVAVADDATAVYYNPAGLSQLEKRDFSVTSLVNNVERNRINYDDTVIYAEPDRRYGAWGLYFLNAGYKGKGWTNPEYQYGASWGKEIFRGFSIGAGGQFIYSKYEIKGTYEATDDNGSLDLGLLYKPVRWFSIGCLVQDVNEPTLWGDVRKFNARPGIAFRPHKRILFAYDIYDVGNSVKLEHSFGMEWWMSRYFALRAGGYHDDPTGGLGIKIITRRGIDYKIDYAYQYRNTTDKGVHRLGFGVAF